jgi:tetratricopeptide (TPR) repeat protein
MSRLSRLILAFVALFGAIGTPALATDNPAMDAEVNRIADQWARIRYLVRDSNAQYNQLATLAEQASAVAARYPNRAEPLLWLGIVTSEEAARASIFRQLGFARSARDILQRAAAINANAGQGGVNMTLGVLYYKVPRSPIGFGDPARAGNLLRSALAQNPAGLDANFFYADYLESRGDHAGARNYANRALRAPHDSSRLVWDVGRRAEARALLARIGG